MSVQCNFSYLKLIPTCLFLGQKFGETISLEVGNMILKFCLELLTRHTPLRLISINHGIIQILVSKFFHINKSVRENTSYIITLTFNFSLL